MRLWFCRKWLCLDTIHNGTEKILEIFFLPSWKLFYISLLLFCNNNYSPSNPSTWYVCQRDIERSLNRFSMLHELNDVWLLFILYRVDWDILCNCHWGVNVRLLPLIIKCMFCLYCTIRIGFDVQLFYSEKYYSLLEIKNSFEAWTSSMIFIS